MNERVIDLAGARESKPILVANMQACRTIGCGTLIRAGLDFCDRCTEELRALNQMAWARANSADREPWWIGPMEVAIAFGDWCKASWRAFELSRVADALVLAFVVGSIAWISLKYGEAFAAWLNSLAGVR